MSLSRILAGLLALAFAATTHAQTAPRVRDAGDPKLADFLQQVAADTVKEYFGRQL